MHLLGASELNDKTVIPELKKAILDETLAFLAEAPEGEISIQANLWWNPALMCFMRDLSQNLNIS